MNYSPEFFELADNGIWSGNEQSPPYLFTDEIAITVDVAYATGRPLLVSGPPGSGKSTLAQAIAGIQACSYFYYTLTSRSRIEDLTGDVDQLQRLHDAQAAAKKDIELLPDWAYQKPGLFWWAFEPDSAKRKGGRTLTGFHDRIKKPEIPGRLVSKKVPEAVLLLDEIDKAEPDLPNDLLEPLDRRTFRRPDGKLVNAPNNLKLLVVITTNRERALPAAFLRRCVSLELEKPSTGRLINIAAHHFPDTLPSKEPVFKSVAEKYQEIYTLAEKQDRRPPGTSEYLDAVRACLDLEVMPDSPVWKQVEMATLVKTTSD